MALYARPANLVAGGLYASLGIVRDADRNWEYDRGQWLWASSWPSDRRVPRTGRPDAGGDRGRAARDGARPGGAADAAPGNDGLRRGMHVFPGGRVDAADAAQGLAARSGIGATAAHIAAVRELWEESGILLADFPAPTAELEAARGTLVAGSATFEDLAEALDLRLRTDLLAPLSRWVTPPGYPRRFDAQFFAAVLPDDAAAPSIASDEVVALEWFRPGDALDAMAEGRIGLWLPTSSTLQQLESVGDVATWRGSLPVRSGRSSSTNPLAMSSASSCRRAAASPGNPSARTSSGAAGSCWSTPGIPPGRRSNGVSRRPPDEPARSAPSP